MTKAEYDSLLTWLDYLVRMHIFNIEEWSNEVKLVQKQYY